MLDVAVIDDPAVAAVSLDPVRARLLAALAEPASAASLAAGAGLTRQKANYHLRALERSGLIELVEERRKGNCTERVMRATAASYVISPAAMEAVAPDTARARDPDHLTQGPGRMRDEVHDQQRQRLVERGIGKLERLGVPDHEPHAVAGGARLGKADVGARPVDASDASGRRCLGERRRERAGSRPDIEHRVPVADRRKLHQLRRQPAAPAPHELFVGVALGENVWLHVISEPRRQTNHAW